MYGFFYASACVLGVAQFFYGLLFVMAWSENKDPCSKILWFCFSLFIGPIVGILFWLNTEGYIPNSYFENFGLEGVYSRSSQEISIDPKFNFVNSKFKSQILSTFLCFEINLFSNFKNDNCNLNFICGFYY